MLHGRWAMLGTLGCLIPEVLHKYTAIDYGTNKGVWFQVVAMTFEFDGLNYMGAPVLVHAGLLRGPDGCHRCLPCERWSIRWM